ncbi:hypothetical protein CCACVL1_21415 [Corchorus capsularis]|uniref:Uncharacterized protein n=1 Tax=Corchorus capsularis TaxID=210143 RepID=A0A1R3H683_COCAP|nr:hypothetical protein CCACVL1_21415 [Corchorus capsularis]
MAKEVSSLKKIKVTKEGSKNNYWKMTIKMLSLKV